MQNNKSKLKNWYFRVIVRGFLALLLILAVIFILAGRISYWQGWVFGGVIIILFLVSLILFVNKTELVKERLKPGPGVKWWDKVFYVFYILLWTALIILSPLDAGRYKWSPQLPASVYIISYIVFAFSNFCIMWAKWTNTYFSTVVRIQTDREHKVVQNGPYRFVRHPGYVGGILLAVSIPILLGSLWALIPACLNVILIIIRTYLEDTTLQKELQGYADYVKKVRYRLLPEIW